jgi:hypothetical protein
MLEIQFAAARICNGARNDSSALVSRKSGVGGSVRPIGADSQWSLKPQVRQAEDCPAPFQGS